jgi:hypothetical protein
MDRAEYQKLYNYWWRYENIEYLKQYRKALKPNPNIDYTIARKRTSKKSYEKKLLLKQKDLVKKEKPAAPPKIKKNKKTAIENKRRKIELNLEKIKIRQQAWHEQNKSASIINENTTLDAQGQEADGNVC